MLHRMIANSHTKRWSNIKDVALVLFSIATFSSILAKYHIHITQHLSPYLSSVVIVMLTVIIVHLKLYKKHNSYFEDLRKIPGPRSFYFFGNRWMYYKMFGPYKLNKLHLAYKDLFNIYGNIFREEFLWNFPVINIKEKDDLQLVLKSSMKSKYPLRPPNEVTAYYRKSRPDRYTNLGLVNEQGLVWHTLRTSLTSELTSGRVMERFLPELNLVSDDFIRLIKLSTDENNVVSHFADLANLMGLESTCTLVLGKRLDFLNKELNPITSKLAQAVKEQFIASRDTFYGLPLWKLFPTPAYRKFIKSEDTIYEIISNMVDEAINDENETCAADNDVQSVFVSILNAPKLDLCDKKAAVIDFIAAGIKTFGNTLVFVLYLIAKYPECQIKIHDEIVNMVPTNQNFTLKNLQNAKYLRASIQEAFRILPTAPLFARITEEKLTVSGFDLPAGSVLLCHTWLACLDNDNFSEAHLYKPERWLTDSKLVNSFLVCPFGVGRRMCPGKRFTELELQVCVANIIREFNVRFQGELDLEFEFLLTPASPTAFIFEPR